MSKEFVTTPFLRLDTEMHTAIIRHISTDNRGRYALTVSDDKTAKLWDIISGDLLQTYRPPIGTGNVGKLYAGALSPDGRRIALGGWISNETGNHSIYIFSTTSGQLIDRIEGLPNVVNDLGFSPDGQYLAAAIGGSNGIRIFQTTDFQLISEDSSYSQRCVNLTFDSWGRLATACYDGHVRLYDKKFKLSKKVVSTGGKLSCSLAFSPDTQLLVVGFGDSPNVQVLDAQGLQVRYEVDNSGADSLNMRLNIVSFSADGRFLAAGGFYEKVDEGRWQRQLRIWEAAGKGEFVDITAASNSIMDVKPLPDGRFLYCGSEPDWGIIDPQTKTRTIYKRTSLNSYASDDESHFCLGPNGLEIGVKPSSKSAIVFTIPGRKLLLVASEHPHFSDNSFGLKITNWQSSYEPKLNDQLLGCLKSHECCYCVDIANGGQGIVLGTNWSLRCVGAAGQQHWEQSMPEFTWCVKIDAYKRVVAAGLGDGTIRWFRFRDGEPLLTLFLHPDNEHWILWTPSGYYDCSPGAEKFIGWHVNKSADEAADFYPISRFRDTYYRPDIIDLILETLDEKLAIADANVASNRKERTLSLEQQLPPVVRILGPAPDSEVQGDSLELSYTIDSPNGEAVTMQRILIDGRPIAQERGAKPVGQRLETNISLPDKDCTVSVIVENRFGASEATSIPIRRGMGRAEVPKTEVIPPSVYLLAIGVNDYEDEQISNLKFAARDATDFVAVMKKQEGLLYKKVDSLLLTNEKATKDNILDGLEWLQRQTTSRDIALLFFAGHGYDDNSSNFFYLPANTDLNRLRRTGLPQAEVQTTVASVAGKIVVFMDACHSGAVMREQRRRNLPPDIVGVINELVSAENGAVVFSSATTRQYALESEEWGNGAFTKALLEGLDGKAKSGASNKVTVKTLDAYVAERVKTLTEGKQSPATVYPPNVPDFPIGIVS